MDIEKDIGESSGKLKDKENNIRENRDKPMDRKNNIRKSHDKPKNKENNIRESRGKPMDNEKNIREAVMKYSDMLYKICIVMLCNEQDVQDAIQDTFCRYFEKKPVFRDEEHEKAWLIKVATNICRDMLRFRIRHPNVAIEEVENILIAPEQKEILKELLELPVKQKTVIYLHYVEEYSVKEIAEILGITESAVKSRLLRGREEMRNMIHAEGGI